MLAETDVVIVGGGLAGLSAATYLARAGVSVTLFEKAAEVGGRAATQNLDGYYFNRGAHALYQGGATTQVLDELQLPYNGANPKGVLALHAGRFHLLPADTPALLRTGLLTAADKLDLLRVLLAAGMQPAHKYRQVSIQAWITAHTRRPRVRQVLASVARTFTYSAALDQVSTEVFATQLQLSMKRPVLYLHGGWQTLADGLRRAATAAGAQVVTGGRVEAVLTDTGRATGVRLADGRTVPAHAVLLAVPPADAARLVGGPHSALRDQVAALVPVQIACLDVALRRVPAPQHPVVFDLDAPRFLTTQSLFAQVTPPGGGLVHTIKYLDPAQPGDPHADERALEALLDTVHPGWQAVLVKRITLPRIEAVSALPTAQSGGLAGRPGPTVPDLAGLYLAGDWIGPEGYLADASFASARHVARRLLAEDLTALRATASPRLRAVA